MNVRYLDALFQGTKKYQKTKNITKTKQTNENQRKPQEIAPNQRKPKKLPKDKLNCPYSALCHLGNMSTLTV